MRTIPTPAWALLLAGGDGRRLKRLTQQIAGDPRPKQYCGIFDGETLLDRTRRRAELVTRPDQQVVVVTRAHEPYFRSLTTELAPGRLVVQPRNAGTSGGILYPLLRIRELAGNVPVAVFPSDHYVSNDGPLVAAVLHAISVAQAHPAFVVLLGVEASAPETEYGWIDPDPVPLPLPGEPAFPIRRFWEKPSLRLAQRLFERGALWNSFIMVGWVDASSGSRAAWPPTSLLPSNRCGSRSADRARRRSPSASTRRSSPVASPNASSYRARMASSRCAPRAWTGVIGATRSV